jgi:hypothetical protein
MERAGRHRSYQVSPGQPCPVRESRASTGRNPGAQRDEAITCRGWTPRNNAEGHADAEPQTKTKVRFRIRVGSPVNPEDMQPA